MATRNITTKIQMRQDTAANWASKNPVLAAGEIGYDTTNKQTKIGDGTTAWAGLPAFAMGDVPPISFQNDSWGTIAKLASEGTADIYYAVGDEKDITLTTGETITLRILGFNHDDLTDGGKAAMTIGMKNLLAATYYMNSSDTNVGGWGSSHMRNTTMATLYGLLPAEVQAVIKPVNKLTSAGNTSSTINTTSDSLFLLSEIEIFDTLNSSYTGEGSRYAWFAAHNTAAERIKYFSNGTGSAGNWWLRSPRTGSSDYFCYVDNSGWTGGTGASKSLGVALGFCV